LPPLVATNITQKDDVTIITIAYTALVVGVSDRRTHKELVPMSRTLAALASVVLTVSGLVFLLPDCASACMCLIEGSPKERAKRAISGSDAVFSGEVVGLEKPPPDTEMIEGTMLTVMMGGVGRKATVTLRVAEVRKSPKQQTVQFTTPVADGISCAHPFKEGREYLVYANGGQDLRVDGCSETKLVSEAGADLALLGNSEKPKDGGDALTDTSGGVSVGAMVGLAGLAMAASFLLLMRLLRVG